MATTAATNTPPQIDAVKALEQERVLQSYGRYNLMLERGKGCYVYDPENNRYLDFITGIGVNALGHGHPRLVKAMREQMGKLIHCSNLYYHHHQGPLAAKLAEISGLDRVFFANSGTESVELALKISKAYGRKQSPDKYEIIALNESFAGRTLGAVSITGQPKYREPYEPLIPGVKFINPNDVAALEAAVSEKTCAIFFEPILGEGGIVEISRDFARKARELADKFDALLVFDEIQCGLGRAGSYFAFQLWNRPTEADPNPAHIYPDVLTAAKPLAGGLPLGAVICNARAAAMITPGAHGSTFGGGPLTTRAAIEFLDVMDELLPMIKEHGTYFARRLGELAMKHAIVVGPRGKGLMVGLELTEPGGWVVPAAQAKGLLLNCTAGTILRFLPPYIIERRHIDQAIAVLDDVFTDGPPPK